MKEILVALFVLSVIVLLWRGFTYCVGRVYLHYYPDEKEEFTPRRKGQQLMEIATVVLFVLIIVFSVLWGFGSLILGEHIN